MIVQGSVATTPGRQTETAVGTSGGKGTLPAGHGAHAASGNAGSTASQSVAGSDTAANQDTPRSAVSQDTSSGKTVRQSPDLQQCMLDVTSVDAGVGGNRGYSDSRTATGTGLGGTGGHSDSRSVTGPGASGTGGHSETKSVTGEAHAYLAAYGWLAALENVHRQGKQGA